MTKDQERARSQLTGRIALVTGASSGIGRAIALALREAGTRVIAVGRDRRRLGATVAPLPGCEPAEAIICDLVDDEAVARLAERVRGTYGALDVLAHSAGAISFGLVSDAPVEQLDDLLDANLRAPYILTRALLPLLVEHRGHVVFINSSAGIRPSAGAAAYGASKHALRGLADALRSEVNPAGVRVTSVYPGRTSTPMQATVARWERRAEQQAGLLDASDVAAIVLAVVTLPHGAEVTDVHVRPTRPLNDGPSGDAGLADGARSAPVTRSGR